MQTTSTTTTRDLIASEKGWNMWVVWAVILLVGLGAWLFLASMDTDAVVSFNRTQTAAVRLQGNVDKLVAQTRLSAHGDEQALGEISGVRNQIQEDLGLLQRGGFLFSDDKSPATGVGDSSRAGVSALQTSLASFDTAAQPVLGASEVLRQSAQAENALSGTLKNLRDGVGQMQKTQGLSSGAWGNALAPLRQEFSRTELNSLPLVFAPNANPTLAQQWTDLMVARAADSKRLASTALNDPNLSAAEKDLLNRWTQNIAVLSNQLQVLSKNMSVRARAQSSLPSVVEASAPLEAAASALTVAVHRSLSQVEAPNTFKIIAIVMSFVGALGLLYSVWNITSTYALARGGTVRGNQLNEAADRLTRNVRKAIGMGGVRQDVSEPTDSPLFTLSSMINQMLASVSGTIDLVTEQNRNLVLTTDNSDTQLSSVLHNQRQQQEALTSIHVNTQSSAEELSSLSQELEQLTNAFSDLSNAVAHGGAMAKENLWGMDEVRENTQATSKRVKRLGETTQNITTDVEVVKEVSRKVKVLALNMALQSSSLGASGRPFSALAQELERLAQNCDLAIKDIDSQIDTIQNDAKETVASMESGTGVVVRCAKLSASAEAAFKNVEKTLQPLKNQTEQASSRVKDMSSVLREEVNHTASIFQQMQTQGEKIEKVRSSFGVFRNVSNLLQKWLNAPLR